MKETSADVCRSLGKRDVGDVCECCAVDASSLWRLSGKILKAGLRGLSRSTMIPRRLYPHSRRCGRQQRR